MAVEAVPSGFDVDTDLKRCFRNLIDHEDLQVWQRTNMLPPQTELKWVGVIGSQP
jgi:hypothetical protein